MRNTILPAWLFFLLLQVGTSAYSQNVGIGEEYPGSKLSVKGNLSVGNNYSRIKAPPGSVIVEGQIGIGTLLPDSNAILDLSTTSKALMLPRLTQAQRMNIRNPTRGLMVFDTDSNCIYHHNGTTWVGMATISQVNELINNALSNLNGLSGSSNYRGSISYTGWGAGRANLEADTSTSNILSTGAANTSTKHGLSSTTGIKGTTGSTGNGGYNGITGPTGADGLNGATGATGATGAAGANGVTGPTGPGGSVNSAGWSLTGNSSSAGSFIGTTNNLPLIFEVNNIQTGYLGGTDNNTFFGNQTSYAGGNNNIGIGYKATVTGKISNSIAIGNSSLVQPLGGGSDDIAIGNGANVSGSSALSYSTVIGSMAQAQSSNSIVIGHAANTNQQYTVTIGDAANALGTYATAIGRSAYANLANGISLGNAANSQGASAISIGQNAYTSATSAIAIGSGEIKNATQAMGIYSIALGYRSNAGLQDAIAIGDNASAQGTNSIAIGGNVFNGNDNSVAIGNLNVTSTLLNGASSASYALMVGTNNTNGNGAYLTTGGTWTNASDKNLKEDFTILNADDILNKITHLDITRWKYKGTNEYHIGPMAQDFYAMFNVGVDNKRISSVDPSGVALVAIKALSEKVDEQQKIIQELLNQLSKK